MNAVNPLKNGRAADQIGAFPANYETDALPLRRLAAYSRLISTVAAIEGCAIIALSLALATLLPLQKVVPMVVTASNKGDQIIHINPLTLDAPTSDYVTEVALRDYILRRYSVIGNASAQATQWGPGSPVQLMSAPDVYEKFVTKATPEYALLRQQNMLRTVRIDRISKLGESTWQAEFTTTDATEANPVTPVGGSQSRAWVSTFTVTFEPKNVTYSQRLINPLGLTITDINDALRD